MCPGSGGWTQPKPNAKLWKATEKNGNPLVQLYDMSMDIGEQTNLAGQHPDIVARLRGELEKIVANGRSTPGPKLTNDVAVNIDKRPKTKK